MAKSFKKYVWVKNWSGNWSACFCSFYGYLYSQELKNRIGRTLHDNLLIYEPLASSNYFPIEQITSLGKFLAGLIVKNPSLVKKWGNEVIRQTDGTMALIKLLNKKPNLTGSDFLTLRQAIYDHIMPNFFIKKAADYLPQQILNANIKQFRYIRTYTEPVYNQADGILKKILKAISRTERYPKKLLLTMTNGEIKTYFTAQKLPAKTQLAKRQNGFAMYYIKGKEKIITGSDFKNLIQAIVPKAQDSIIKGAVAYAGKAVGTVKIVFEPKKATGFKRGDILVTGMTRPEFLPLMKIAGAIITDAGGILSHAAIVAREMKKPCIIGTEIATKVFKDGDMVEVDANKGTVKKVK